MYDGKVSLAIYRPRDPAAMREEACIQPASSGGAVKVAVNADDDVAQRTRSVLIVSVRIQGAEGVEHCELTGRSEFEDRASAILAAERGHTVNYIVGAARQCHAWRGSVRILSVRSSALKVCKTVY